MSLIDSEVWRVAIGAVGSTDAGSGVVLFWAAIAGTLVAILLPVAQKVLTIRAGVSAWCKAVPTMKLAFAILLLAWAIKSVCADTLHTDKYLASVLGESMPIKALPLATFLLAAGISFATGTSWGTMGILLPVALPLAYSMGAWELDQRLFFWLTAAAVLDGAIFGDHVSPISDTTVLSSIASGCDHIDHVVTQAPYGVTCMILAGAAGYAGVAAGLPVWLAYILLAAGAVGVFLVVGKPLPVAGK
jgi:Na+/H+ antiporter NhaC